MFLADIVVAPTITSFSKLVFCCSRHFILGTERAIEGHFNILFGVRYYSLDVRSKASRI